MPRRDPETRRKNDALDAAKRAYHAEELYVAAAHAFPLSYKLIRFRNGKEQAGAHQHAAQRVGIAERGPEERKGDPEKESAEAQYVRDYQMVQVNEGYDDEQARKNERDGQFDG